MERLERYAQFRLADRLFRPVTWRARFLYGGRAGNGSDVRRLGGLDGARSEARAALGTQDESSALRPSAFRR